ncbi:major facilitator superfamily domain-containing protein [Lipomyces oligophaga]|uniref:major facilitator superfamily domain-containing protein n=1 Tax=Lipomyces oligophaga TaxID=45792 RepID=UPI0034CDDE63
MPVPVHGPVSSELPGVEVELVAESASDPELLLHRVLSRDQNRNSADVLVRIPTAKSTYSTDHPYPSGIVLSIPEKEADERTVSASARKEKDSFDHGGDSEDGSQCTTEAREPPILLDFAPDDPTDPRNFSPVRKMAIVVILIISLLNATFASSLTSGCSTEIREQFNVASIMTSLLVSLYMVGYVIGPLFWAPLSEHVGRKYIILSSFSCYFVFSIACAVAPNIGSLIVFRFLQGLCATCPIAVSGGVFADIYSDPIKRGRAVALFCGATIMGALAGPFISGYIATSYLGWRWVFWINSIFAGVTLVFLLIILPETFRPVILVRRAAVLRKSGENVVAAYELEDKTLRAVVLHVLLRPINMLFQEVIVAAVCVYVGFAYGLLYMFFMAYPIIFQEYRGMSPGKGGLMILPIGIGAILVTICHYRYDIWVQRQRTAGKVISLEHDRLFVTSIASFVMPIGIYWLAWTSYKSVPFGVTMLGGIFFGFGFCSLFIGFMNYVTDCYKIYAASGHGIMSVTRSLIAASFPLFAPAMYHRMGIHWATTLWALLATCLAPISYLFYRYGHLLRARSKWATALAKQNL